MNEYESANTTVATMARYHRWLLKQIDRKPKEAQLMMRRTFNTSVFVSNTLRDIPFESLSKELFFYCSDIKMRDFTRLYEAQIELASIDEEKFVKGLHKFFNATAVKIKKDNLYQEFFEFISLAIRVRYSIMDEPDEKRRVTKQEIANCYQSLLMQQMEYLRPNKFDMATVVCGQTTDGEIMTIRDTMPDFDEPGYELEDKLEAKKFTPKSQEELQALVIQIYQKYGFNIKDFDDIEVLNQRDRIFSCHQCALSPFINEYTYDILPDPDNPLTPRLTPLAAFQTDINADEMVERLRHRAKTLPTNGVEFHLISEEKERDPDPDKHDIIEKVLIKEILYGDTIMMLYRISTSYGDISGYYDTKEGFFFSILLDGDDHRIVNSLRELVLYLYACMVCRNGAELLSRITEDSLLLYAAWDRSITIPIKAVPYAKGGKLLNVYRPEKNAPSSPTGKRAGSDKYESEERAIQGFIRRVGAGKSPSEEAVARAKALGYDLAANETYVQPFMRHVLKLKRKTEAD